jgi:hypothetical protein
MKRQRRELVHVMDEVMVADPDEDLNGFIIDYLVALRNRMHTLEGTVHAVAFLEHIFWLQKQKNNTPHRIRALPKNKIVLSEETREKNAIYRDTYNDEMDLEKKASEALKRIYDSGKERGATEALENVRTVNPNNNFTTGVYRQLGITVHRDLEFVCNRCMDVKEETMKPDRLQQGDIDLAAFDVADAFGKFLFAKHGTDDTVYEFGNENCKTLQDPAACSAQGWCFIDQELGCVPTETAVCWLRRPDRRFASWGDARQTTSTQEAWSLLRVF